LLLFAPIRVDRIHAQRALNGRKRTHPRIAALQLLEDEAVADVVHPGAPVALQARAEDAHLRHLRNQLVGEGAVAKMPADHREVLAVDEVGHQVARRLFVLGEQVVDSIQVGDFGARHGCLVRWAACSAAFVLQSTRSLRVRRTISPTERYEPSPGPRRTDTGEAPAGVGTAGAKGLDRIELLLSEIGHRGEHAAGNDYLLGSYRIATAPEPNSSRLMSLKSTGFDSPANNVGPWPASLGCTTNSYSSINPSSANASGSFTPPTSSPLPDSRLSC